MDGITGTLCDEWNNTYACLRSLSSAPHIITSSVSSVSATSSTDFLFCQFTCFDDGRLVVPCDSTQAEGKGEYYDLTRDRFAQFCFVGMRFVLVKVAVAQRDRLALIKHKEGTILFIC